LTAIIEAKREDAARLLPHGFRGVDAAGRRKPLEASSDVHAVAQQIAMPDKYVTGVDADPKLHPNPARKRLVLSREHGLYLKCATQGVDNAAEFSKHAVARRIRDPALI